jgi:hypothetical protein
MVRPEVERLVSLGQLPPEGNADPSRIEMFQEAIAAIARPVSAEEARLMIDVFGPDDSFGLAWALLHLIETAPELPITDEPAGDANEWVRELWERAHR